MFGLTDKWIAFSNIRMLKAAQCCIGIGKVEDLEGDGLNLIFACPLGKRNGT